MWPEASGKPPNHNNIQYEETCGFSCKKGDNPGGAAAAPRPSYHLERLRRRDPYICCSAWAVFAQVIIRLPAHVPCLIYFSFTALTRFCTYVFTECQNSTWKKSYDFLKNVKKDLNIGFFSFLLSFFFLLSSFFLQHFSSPDF